LRECRYRARHRPMTTRSEMPYQVAQPWYSLTNTCPSFTDRSYRRILTPVGTSGCVCVHHPNLQRQRYTAGQYHRPIIGRIEAGNATAQRVTTATVACMPRTPAWLMANVTGLHCARHFACAFTCCKPFNRLLAAPGWPQCHAKYRVYFRST
jgi:hypothetical protein